MGYADDWRWTFGDINISHVNAKRRKIKAECFPSLLIHAPKTKGMERDGDRSRGLSRGKGKKPRKGEGLLLRESERIVAEASTSVKGGSIQRETARSRGVSRGFWLETKLRKLGMDTQSSSPPFS